MLLSQMAEAGVDISEQRAKHVDELREIEFDLVVIPSAMAPGRAARCRRGRSGSSTEASPTRPRRKVRRRRCWPLSAGCAI
ncbi:hypothetical protein [Thermodesulfitimonas sp.]